MELQDSAIWDLANELHTFLLCAMTVGSLGEPLESGMSGSLSAIPQIKSILHKYIVGTEALGTYSGDGWRNTQAEVLCGFKNAAVHVIEVAKPRLLAFAERTFANAPREFGAQFGAQDLKPPFLDEAYAEFWKQFDVAYEDVKACCEG